MLSLIKQGYSVFVAAPHDDFADLLADKGIGYIQVNKMNNKGTSIVEDFALMLELIKIYQSLKPSLIFHYTVKPNIYGTLAARLQKIPSIAIITGLGYAFAKRNIISWVVKRLYQISLKFAKEVWFLNNEDCETFLHSNIISRNKAFVLNSEGVNLNHFSPMEKSIISDQVIFLFSARILIEKGIKEFIESIIKLNNLGHKVKGEIVGFLDAENPSGLKKTDLEKLLEGHPSLEYKGSTKDIRQYIKNSDCIVLPSYYKEGVPRILLEAAAMAKPLITTNSTGCRETIDNQITGYFCEPKDVNSLIEAMSKIINLSVEERLEMGKKGRQKMQTYFDEKMVINIYIEKTKKYTAISFP